MSLYRTVAGILRFGGGGGILRQSTDAIAASLVVEYVGLDGERHTTPVVNGVTSITVQAPALIQFDATGTRGTQSGVDDTEGLAMVNLGYRMNYGDTDMSGTWPISGEEKGEDLGPPLFAWAYESVGTYTPRLKVRDSLGRETTITVNVTTVAPTNVVTLTTGWPGTFADDTEYRIATDTDRDSWGVATCVGAKNVVIRGFGAGAPPEIAGINFEERSDEAWTSDTRTRTPIALSARSKHIRVVNCNVGAVTYGSIGFDYCGIINGTVRPGGLIRGGLELHYSYRLAMADATNREARCNNHRWYRGYFVWNVGTVESESGGACWFGGGRSIHVANCDMLKNTGDDQSWPIRPYPEKSTFRHSKFRSNVETVTLFKGCPKIARPGTPGEQNDEDRFGDFATEFAVYQANSNDATACLGHVLGSKNSFVHQCQFGDTGDFDQIFFGEFAPQNDVVPTDPVTGDTAWETCNYSGFEDCWSHDNRDVELHLGGAHLFAKGVRRNMGAGVAVTVGTSYRTNKLSVDGPYYVEGTNTRPVPSAF